MEPLSFGHQVKARRKALDLSREELAQQVGCSVDMLRKIEVGHRRPSKQMAARLAKGLEIAAFEQPDFIRNARSSYKAITSVQPCRVPENAPETEPIEHFPLPIRESRIHGFFSAQRVRLFAIGLVLFALGFTGSQYIRIAEQSSEIPTTSSHMVDNKIVNGDFNESYGWIGSDHIGIDTCCAYQDSVFPNGSSPSAYARLTGDANPNATLGLWQNIPALPIGQYTLGAWVKTSDSRQRALIQADNGDPAHFPPYCTTTWLTSDDWQHVSCSFAITRPQIVHVALIADNTPQTRGGWVAWDSVTLVQQHTTR